MQTAKRLMAGFLGITLAAGAQGQIAQSEWHFDGDLTEVGGPSRLRFLDDPDFGPLPSGIPPGQTRFLGGFGTTTEMGIPLIQRVDVPVFRVPAPRDPLGLPSRGIGLVLWPSNRGNHPDGLVDQWTIVMDLLIPSNSFGPGPIVPIINFDDNNGDDADLFIMGPAAGGPPIGYIGPRDQLLPAVQIQPDRWVRVCLVVDNIVGPASGFTTRMFANGDFIGQANFSRSLLNRVMPESPTFADGTAVPAALWASWGQFPSPWGTSPSGDGMLSTATLFSDNDGEGRPFFLAKLYMTDTNISDADASGMDEPNPDRIVLCDVPCAADFNNDCEGDVFDLLAFLDAWFAGDFAVDLNLDAMVDVFDLLLYLDDWFAGC